MFHRVLVAGIGALGSEVVKNLGLLGCESVFLADADVLATKNIDRSMLFREGAHPGRSKVSCALDRLRTWFPQTQWDGAPVEIADVEEEHFLKAEVLFSCVDTDLARTEIAALAARYQLPVCDAGLGGTSTFIGRVSWFPGNSSDACFACLLSGKRRAELLSMWEAEVHACWARHADIEAEWTSSATMASMVGGLQVEVACSARNRMEQEAYSIHLELGGELVSRSIRHRRSPECAFHEEMPATLFPLCALAVCNRCGEHYSPQRRIAWMRRRGTCPACGSSDLVIHASSSEPAWSAR